MFQMTSLPLLLTLPLTLHWLLSVAAAAAVPLSLLSTHWPGRVSSGTRQLQHLPKAPPGSILDAVQAVSSQLSSSEGLMSSSPQFDKPERWDSRFSTSGLSLYFPDVDQHTSGRRQRLQSIVKRVSAETFSGISRTPVDFGEERKRGASSPLCHMLGFAMGTDCLQKNYNFIWERPDTRSAPDHSTERKDWPSMYLLGGAIGR